MQRRSLGKSDLKISPILMGTWQAGEEKRVSLGQLAPAWIISRSGACAIAGARSADQASQNAAAADITLSEADLVLLDESGRLVTDHLDNDPMMWRF